MLGSAEHLHMEIHFLGSGGGRWVTLTQKLRTGGIRLHAEAKVHLDPGPGAVLSMAQAGLNPLDTDAVFVTHSHPDHYTDSHVMIEAMTRGMRTRRGIFGGSRSVVLGEGDAGPVVTKYHLGKVGETHVITPGGTVSTLSFRVRGLEARHSDPTTVGLSFEFEDGVVAYTSDTEYFQGMSQSYEEARVLIINVIRPASRRIPWHLCTEDVIKILEEVKPELAILNHFGMNMIGVASREAERVQKATGVRTVAAKDFMRVVVNEGIEVESGVR